MIAAFAEKYDPWLTAALIVIITGSAYVAVPQFCARLCDADGVCWGAL